MSTHARSGNGGGTANPEQYRKTIAPDIVLPQKLAPKIQRFYRTLKRNQPTTPLLSSYSLRFHYSPVKVLLTLIPRARPRTEEKECS